MIHSRIGESGESGTSFLEGGSRYLEGGTIGRGGGACTAQRSRRRIYHSEEHGMVRQTAMSLSTRCNGDKPSFRRTWRRDARLG